VEPVGRIFSLRGRFNMYMIIELKEGRKITIWNVRNVYEFGDYLCIGIHNTPDKEIPKEEIKKIKLCV